MAENSSRLTTEKLDIIVGNLLRAGVRGFALKAEAQMLCGESLDRAVLAVDWMRHQGGVDALHCPGSEQQDLTASTFLGRSAQNHHAAGQPVPHG